MKKGVFLTRVMRGQTLSMRDLGGGTLVNWIFALPITLAIGLVLVHILAGGEVALFLDQLVVAGDSSLRYR